MNAKERLSLNKWKADLLIRESKAEEKGFVKGLMISEQKPGQSPGDDRTKDPYDKNWPPKPIPAKDRPKLAMNFEDAGFGEGGFVSTDKPHIYINRGAEAYILMPDGDFRFDGMYDPKRHGNAFPGLGLVQRNAINDMKIAKKKPDEQRAYEDFVRDSQNMPLDESFKDLRRGQDGEGFDILRELLDLDEAKNRLKINPKVANLPYQDGRAPTRPFYNNPYPGGRPDLFIKTRDLKKDAWDRYIQNINMPT